MFEAASSQHCEDKTPGRVGNSGGPRSVGERGGGLLGDRPRAGEAGRLGAAKADGVGLKTRNAGSSNRPVTFGATDGADDRETAPASNESGRRSHVVALRPRQQQDRRRRPWKQRVQAKRANHSRRMG